MLHATNHTGNATTSGCGSFSSFFVGLGFSEFRIEFSYSNEDLMICLFIWVLGMIICESVSIFLFKFCIKMGLIFFFFFFFFVYV